MSLANLCAAWQPAAGVFVQQQRARSSAQRLRHAGRLAGAAAAVRAGGCDIMLSRTVQWKARMSGKYAQLRRLLDAGSLIGAAARIIRAKSWFGSCHRPKLTACGLKTQAVPATTLRTANLSQL